MQRFLKENQGQLALPLRLQASTSPMNNDIILCELGRLQAAGKPHVLDLFAGCGDISLGCEAGGHSVTESAQRGPRLTNFRRVLLVP